MYIYIFITKHVKYVKYFELSSIIKNSLKKMLHVSVKIVSNLDPLMN